MPHLNGCLLLSALSMSLCQALLQPWLLRVHVLLARWLFLGFFEENGIQHMSPCMYVRIHASEYLIQGGGSCSVLFCFLQSLKYSKSYVLFFRHREM